MRGRLFIILAVAVLGAVSPARAAAAETPWTPVTPAPPVPDNLSSPALLDVTAVSPKDVWAVGGGWTDTEQPLISHWTGAGWSPVTPPSVPDFHPIPVIAHFDGRAWSTVPPPTPPSLSSDTLIGVDMVSATDGWAVGWRQGPPAEPTQPLCCGGGTGAGVR